MNRWFSFLFLFVASTSTTTFGQTSYPMLLRVEPVALRRGSSAEFTFSGNGNSAGDRDVSGAFAVLCEGPGLKGEVVETEVVKPVEAKAKGKKRGNRRGGETLGKARITADPDAPLGPREVRIATPGGVSSVGLILVVNDSVVPESDDLKDDTAKGAQVLELPCVVSGTIAKNEDVDWYAVSAKAGQRVTFSVWANRLENKIHDLQVHFDPILQLFDDHGRELAADDNHDFADPLLSYEFKNDGTYFVQLRDTTYGGNAHWTYALQATAGPVATSVFPIAVNPGKAASLHAKGANIDPSETLTLDVPASLPHGPQFVALPTSKGPTLAVPVVVTGLPITTEKGDTATVSAKAQPVSIPSAVCGRLGEANDIDAYRFEAKKGQVFAFEVVARRAGAATDPVLKVVNDKSATLVEADDSPGLGKDPRLEWTAPADGTFALVVNDLHNRGGDEFGYAILATPGLPDFTMTCDPDKLNVGPGGRVPLFVKVARRTGFAGPVSVELGGLPTGVSASRLTIDPKMSEGVIVVSANSSVEHTAVPITLTGKAETLVRAASPRQEIYLPGGGRAVYPVETLALGVTDPSDIAVDATPKSITLAPGGTATLDVTVTRRAGFEQGVNLAIILQHLGGIHANPLPPGITVVEAGSKTLLGPKETRGKIILQAAPTAAPMENVPICVMGHVSINFVVKTAYASEPIGVSIAK